MSKSLKEIYKSLPFTAQIFHDLAHTYDDDPYIQDLIFMYNEQETPEAQDLILQSLELELDAINKRTLSLATYKAIDENDDLTRRLTE